MQIKDKICIITGGTSGIGLEIIKKLLSYEPKHIILFELDNANSRLTFDELKTKYGERVVFYPCDVTNSAQLKENFDKVFLNYKTIDILINNAGILNESTYERMIDINYKAVVTASLKMIDLVGKHKGGKGGVIVNVASVCGLMNLLMPVYCSTKHAVVSFTHTLNQSIETTGVTVLAICPGVTVTPLLDQTSQCQSLEFLKGVKETLNSFPKQSPEVVAQAVAEIIQTDEDEKVWVIAGGKPRYAVKDVDLTIL